MQTLSIERGKVGQRPKQQQQQHQPLSRPTQAGLVSGNFPKESQERRGHYVRRQSGSIFDSGEGSSSLSSRYEGSQQHLHYSASHVQAGQSSCGSQPASSSSIQQVVQLKASEQLPRLSYLLSQNPAISASLPNYAESRALLGSHMIDSGSLDYSVEEPLSLPAVSAHRPSIASSFLQQEAARAGRQLSSEPSTSGYLRASHHFDSSASGGHLMRSQLTSAATTAEPLPSSSATSSSAYYRSSNPASAMSSSQFMATRADSSSRHSALTSLEMASLQSAAGNQQSRHRPIFQKSSSTPSSRGQRSHRQQSMSPPQPLKVMPSQTGSLMSHHHNQSRHSTAALSYSTSQSGPAEQRLLQLEQYVEEDAQLMPHMMDQLQLESASQQQQIYLEQKLHQQHRQSRRLLPQIPRSHSPSQMQSSPYSARRSSTSYQYVDNADDLELDDEQLGLRHVRRRHRRQSSLELERQQQQQLGLSELNVYESHPPLYHPQVLAQDSAAQFSAYRQSQPPTISVSPEFHNRELDFTIRSSQRQRPAYPVQYLHDFELSGGQYKSRHQPAAAQYHDQQVSRSLAMGSDSELNTRGLSSNKLYYVHVPPNRRSRHQRRQPQVPTSQLEPLDSNQLKMQQQQQLTGGQLEQPSRHSSRFPQAASEHRTDLTHRSHPIINIADYVQQPYATPQQVQQHHQPHQLMQHPPLAEDQTSSRASKGVTFDGRTSAPVYGRSKRSSRENYLRTNSEEYRNSRAAEQSPAEESEDNEEQSSSIASKASNGSEKRQRATITGAEFNVGRRAPYSSQQRDERHLLATTSGESSRDSKSATRRTSRTAEFSQLEPRRVHSKQHQSVLDAGSLSDTGGAASLSDRDAGSQASRLGPDAGSGETLPGRSERRARVRDQHQDSSNERSIGDAGGSSQSLKSQSGPGNSSGLGKKSNSTTQLSLSGKYRHLNLR